MKYDLSKLIEIMGALRDPETGCPWDIEQDFKSIAPYTLEEAYEVADAIEQDDMIALREELGDLLLQSVYHAQMASEENLFDLHDVIHDVTHKMITRHPHVFGDQTARNAQDVNVIWDAQKSKEKKKADGQSLLDDVPKAFPALLRAQKLQKKAAKVGFEWPEIGGVLDKLVEEITEIREAIASGNEDHIKDELGDVFFVLVNFARMSGFNAEEIMRGANEKFERRFRGVESRLQAQAKDINQASLDEMEEEWQAVKRAEKA